MVAGAVNRNLPIKNEQAVKSPARFLSGVCLYRPRNNEMTIPNKPITPIPIMTIPIGTRPVSVMDWSGEIVGITNGGGGVNVGKCVGGISTINCAARVGSMVGVVFGVGVGGGSTIGTVPDKVTSGV